MPCRYGVLPAERLKTEFVEADIEMGFRLVDMAESEWKDGRETDRSRLLHDAEGIFQDLGQRIRRFDATRRQLFEPLMGELRRAIDIEYRRG